MSLWDGSYQNVGYEVNDFQEIQPVRWLISKNPRQRCRSWENCVEQVTPNIRGGGELLYSHFKNRFIKNMLI